MAHLSSEELKSNLGSAAQSVEVGEKYFHYKNPDKFYTVTDLVIIEATEEVGVIYEAEYEPQAGVRFVRPISEFLSEVEVGGEVLMRFSRLQ